MNDQELLKAISRKLSVLIAIGIASGDRKLKVNEGIIMLSRFGLTNSEIAEILGTTKRTVEVLKSKALRRGRETPGLVSAKDAVPQ